MKKLILSLILAAAFSSPVYAATPSQPPVTTAKVTPTDKTYDVILDVPNLAVELLKIEVQKLRAKLSLNARVASLVQLTAGADVEIETVKIEIKGVKAEAHLRVSLDNVTRIVTRTLDTLDRNPKLLESVGNTLENLGESAGNTLENVTRPGGVLDNITRPGGLLTQTVNTLGQTLNRTIDTTGNILETTLDKTGKVLNSKTVGNVLDLQVITETRNSAGQITRRVRDKSGAIIEYVLDNAGKVLNSKVLEVGR